MRKLDRTNPFATLATAAMGAAIGLVVQFALSSVGRPPFSPPLSLALSLVLVAAVLVVFGLRLRRMLQQRPGAVNPFHAVRLLATARAGQAVGALIGGFGGGLALSLLGRSIPAPLSSWLPMVMTLAAGAVLVICGAITEHLCQVPPSDDASESGSVDPSPGSVEGTAYRKTPTGPVRWNRDDTA